MRRDRTLVLPEQQAAWNATQADYPRRCLHELFEDQVDRTPNEVAVLAGVDGLSYAELDRRANCLANHLIAEGVAPGTLVGLLVERGPWMMVAILGILKAGAAYLPLDPQYPLDRLDFMVEDAGVGVVVTESHLGELIPQAHLTVQLDRDWSTISAAGTGRARPKISPEDRAYVIFTSGSTGRPKGVQVPHRALVNLLTALAAEPGMGTGDVLLAVTTLSFDIAAIDIFMPLLSGASVVIASREESVDGRALAALMAGAGVGFMQATPATWRMLIDAGWTGNPTLWAASSGEALTRALADELLDRVGELWNNYGPSETCVWSSVLRVEPGEGPIALGGPVANTTFDIVDEQLCSLPVGAAGELVIGGDGVGIGYLNRPELTAEKFVADPLRPDRRRYRTGDLVRWTQAGRMEFLGRIDDQVKLRGYRIELGEVESVLETHPSVTEAVCVVREVRPGDKVLVAYVVTRAPASSAELRAALAMTLPSYMVPSAVILIDSLPRTPNGKTDRQALPTPDLAAIAAERDRIPPRTDLERRLIAVWEEMLGVRPIGVTDNFFDLGISSLVAARLFARIERDFACRLPLAPVFQAPTVEALAELLGGGEQDAGPRWTSLVPMQPAGDRPPVFGVHGGAGTILLYQPMVRRLGDEQPFYGLQVAGLFGGEAPDTTVEAMADRYLREVAEVQAHGPYVLLGYCFGALVAFEMGRRLVDRGEEVALVVALNGAAPSYIAGHKPLWDDEGAPIDVDAPEPPRHRRSASLRAHLNHARTLGNGSAAGTASALKSAAALHTVRTARRVVRRGHYRWVMRTGRPLPAHLRENASFQRIAATAEIAYAPRTASFPMAVFAGTGIYRSDDLGWRKHTTAEVHCIEVPGDEQSVPRDAMKEPYVGFIAEHLQALSARYRPVDDAMTAR